MSTSTYTDRWQKFLQDCGALSSIAEPMQVSGRVTRVTGLVMEAVGLRLAVGSACTVPLPNGSRIEAEVVGFDNDRLFLMPQSDVEGVVPGTRVFPVEVVQTLPRPGSVDHPRRRPSDRGRHLPVGRELLGRILDGTGRPLDTLGLSKLVLALLAVCAVIAVVSAQCNCNYPTMCSCGGYSTGQWGTCDIYQLLQGAGVPSGNLEFLTCVGWYESSYNPQATDNDSNGTTDFGLFQVNSGWWCSSPNGPAFYQNGPGCGGTCQSMFDPQTNANCAAVVLSQQGETAWSTYNDCAGAYIGLANNC